MTIWAVIYDTCEQKMFDSKEKAYDFIVDYIYDNFDEDDDIGLILDMLKEEYEMNNEYFGYGDEIEAVKYEVY